MHENNKKEAEISNVLRYLNDGYTGKGWKFTSFEDIGRKDMHAELTIGVYKEFRPDAEFVVCGVKEPWSSKNIMNAMQWCVGNDVKTVLMSIMIGITEEEAKRYNDALKYAKENGVFVADSIGNNNKDIRPNFDIGTLDELESIGAINYIDQLKDIYRAGYSNRSITLDYVDFTGIMVPEYNISFTGTSCSSPLFNAKRDILREYLETEHMIDDYSTVMSIIDKNLMDLGDVGIDKYYGKGLFILPNEVEVNMKVSEEIPKINMVHPVKNYRITSPFGMRIHPISGKQKMHTGVDYVGNSQIISATDGIVYVNKLMTGYGNTLVIKSGDYLIYYAHLKEKPDLRVGTPVKQGQPIAIMGTTGNSTGVHLHFEVRKGAGTDYTVYNPLKIIEQKGEVIMEQWKLDIIKEAFDKGLIKDLEQWTKKVDEPMPTWAVLQVIMNSMEVK